MIALLERVRSQQPLNFCPAVTVKNNCTCPEIPPKPLTELPTERCFQKNGRFRYSCIEGYVRKAGTSNLIICSQDNGALQWIGGSLECIPDPKIPPQPRSTSGQPSSTTPTYSFSQSQGSAGAYSDSPQQNTRGTAGTDYPESPPQPKSTGSYSNIPQDFILTTTVRISPSLHASWDVVISTSQRGTEESESVSQDNCACSEIPPKPLTELPTERCFQKDGRFRYSCIKGYVRKAGTSNLIKCSQVNGALQWIGGPLECIPDPKLPPQPRSKADLKTSTPSESTGLGYHSRH
ncbi:interleukin-15 receptor subunit alpha [Cololabis saira]|uniref:interleukin-15 receptor subunit alpha n=1 Tax=Cololabis saira TaxID=129043 RepID=UPI002AD1E346|nr:interleukin-15 receptor subunit alpha [Cololabis saira]